MHASVAKGSQLSPNSILYHANPSPLATQPPTLDELMDHVKTTNWFRLGMKLGMETFDLEVIEKDKRSDTAGALAAMLRKWLRTSKDPTWRAVVDALKAINDGQLARKIEKQFL